ncbi:hypothetical protein C5167_033058 [Papaver somniferum]|uniref:Uncharacterized protein n=1 Tax=Papaver somniferum TaxID=3469 RepID=A0A4Y7KAH1_PAPSO|nr:hypothetical protein C5167_033058 [Papaver somniferum]
MHIVPLNTASNFINKKLVREKLFEQGVLTFTMTPVKRSSAFERSDILMGEHYLLKITYPFKVYL